jgi:hypothetical protein
MGLLTGGLTRNYIESTYAQRVATCLSLNKQSRTHKETAFKGQVSFLEKTDLSPLTLDRLAAFKLVFSPVDSKAAIQRQRTKLS